MFRVDHLVGLESFQGLIYCSETTRRFLLNMRDTLDGPPKYRGLERKLVSRIVPGRPPTAGAGSPTAGASVDVLYAACTGRWRDTHDRAANHADLRDPAAGQPLPWLCHVSAAGL